MHTVLQDDPAMPLSTCQLRRMRGLLPDIGNCLALSYPASKVSGRQGHGTPPNELQQPFCPASFGRRAQWWNNRQCNQTPQFRHALSNVPLCQSNRQNPSWMYLQSAQLDAGVKKTYPESASSSIQGQGAIERAHEGSLEIGMCRKLCENGPISEAVNALNLWVQQGCHVGNNLFYLVLKRCIEYSDLGMGRRIHALTIESGYEGDAFLATHLISLYATHERLEEAMRVFNKVSVPTVYNWTSIIFAYARHGDAAQAIRLYRRILDSTTIKPDNRLYVAVLKACSISGDLVAGKEVHAHISAIQLKPNVFVQSALVSMYAKCGSLRDARAVFDRLPQRDVVAWNAMLAGYAHLGKGEEALRLYSSMQREGLTPPDSFTYTCLLQACASVGVGAVNQGKQLHAEIEGQRLQYNKVMGGSLVNMYAKCGSLGDARKVFNRLPERDLVTWTALIAGYVQQGMGQEALSLYDGMQNEGLHLADPAMFVCLLQACASVGVEALDRGEQIHADIEKRGLQEDLVLGGSMVNMYAKCGNLGEARRMFDRLPERDVVTWTALLAGYTQQRMGQEALILYSRMQQEAGIAPESITYVCLLQACAIVGVGALDQGKHLHAEIEEQGLDLVTGGNLVNMYVQCGSLGDARSVFDRLPERDVVTWNALLAGYSQQGMGQQALNLYRSMQLEGLTSPDSFTYVCLLQACSSIGVGALDQGKKFHAEIREQGMHEELVLGGSLVNMYAKCGSLDSAHRVFDSLPEKDVVTWTALIAGYAQQGMGQETLDLHSQMQQEGFTAPNSVTFLCLLHICATIAALTLGKQLHVQIQERGLDADVAVGAGLVDMYGKCGSMSDSQQVFASLPERSVEVWNALISGYARQGDIEVVFDLVDRMRLEGIQPDRLTFLWLLTVCSHVGQVGKGRRCFEAMELDYGISPSLQHYTCMVDLFGRAGHLDEALWMIKTMPFLPDVKVWHSLLGACRKWENVEIGQRAFEYAVTKDGKDGASHVLMSNIFATAKMSKEAKEMQARRVKSQAWKKPGQSWTDIGGVVHTFVVGDKNLPEIEHVYARLAERVEI